MKKNILVTALGVAGLLAVGRATREPADTRPRCPKCGEPARTVLLDKVTVRCALNADGTVGKIQGVEGSATGRAMVAGYECGGGHQWM